MSRLQSGRRRGLTAVLAAASAALVSVPGAIASAAPTYAPAVLYATGVGIPSNVGTSVATGDLDGDSIPDLVSANFGPDSISIFIGDGSGAFGPRTDIQTGRFHSGIALGDLDVDGKLDVVVTDVGGNAVSVLLGNGGGGLGPMTDLGIFCPKSVAIGDLNGDGLPDLAVSSSCGGTTGGVFLGTGGGGFVGPLIFATGGSTGVDPNNRSIAIADMNGDADPDLVIANRFSNDVTVLLGNGTGSFPTPTVYPAGNGAFSLAVGDLDGDGDQDVVTANSFGGDISVLLGDGSGGLGAPTNFATAAGANAIGIDDVNGDGDPDLAVAGGPLVSVFQGDGAGGFGPRFDFATGLFGAFDLELRDLDAGGGPDLAVGSYGSNEVSILLNTTTLTVGIDIKPGGSPNSINTAKKGVIPVAVLGSATFDASDVDPSTVCFGDAEDASQRDCTVAPGTIVEDVNGDAISDLVLHFQVQETGIDPGDTEACLTGALYDGTQIEGCDSIKTR